ncbi:hypothetical protein [Micrococcus luteus]|uniref:hypothetical protein n=1 Tax=Micrococcus luteus TaxID=1270 RepID=UPI00362A9BE6
MPQAPTPKTTAEQIATELLTDPAKAHPMLTNLICTTAYLNARAEWSMEDNLSTTEALCSDFGTLIPDEQLVAIVADSGFDLDPEDVKPRLTPYLDPVDPEED